MIERINARFEFDSEQGIPEEEDNELQHWLADLVLLERKTGKDEQARPEYLTGLELFNSLPERTTKKRLRSLFDLPELEQMYRGLHPGETFDPGHGCRTYRTRKESYVDVIYRHLKSKINF